MLMILLSALESDEDRRKFIALYEQYARWWRAELHCTTLMSLGQVKTRHRLCGGD